MGVGADIRRPRHVCARCRDGLAVLEVRSVLPSEMATYPRILCVRCAKAVADLEGEQWERIANGRMWDLEYQP